MRSLLFVPSACVGLVLLIGAAASAQRHRDPFTQNEIDQIRDASWEPQKRLSLYVNFARARLVAHGADAERPKDEESCRSRRMTGWMISC